MLAEGAVLGGRYRIVRELGRGAWASCTRREQDLNRRVAVKVSSRSVAVRARALSTRGAIGGGARASEHRPGHRFPDADDGPPFLVMELLEGISLGALIDRQGPCPYPRVAFITRRCSRRSPRRTRGDRSSRHQAGQRVPDRAEGAIVKVLDFGIAKLERRRRSRDARARSLGTPAYMPPEQARGAGSTRAPTCSRWARPSITPSRDSSPRRPSTSSPRLQRLRLDPSWRAAALSLFIRSAGRVSRRWSIAR